MEQPASGNKKILAVVGLLVIVVVIGIGVMASSGKKADTLSSSTPTPKVVASSAATASPAVEGSSTSESGFKNGTYSATGSYNTPGGQESITVSVTLADGKITDTSATASGNDRNSQEYQGMFISSYKAQVVGKSIDEVNLTRVSGSSLTSGGFNKAIDQIETQAKA